MSAHTEAQLTHHEHLEREASRAAYATLQSIVLATHDTRVVSIYAAHAGRMVELRVDYNRELPEGTSQEFGQWVEGLLREATRGIGVRVFSHTWGGLDTRRVVYRWWPEVTT